MIRNRPDMAHVTEGRMRVSPLRHMPELVADFGVPYASVLDQLGLPATLLDDPENTIAVRATGELLALSADRARCPHFGLLLGQRASLDSLGLIGMLARHEVDVEAALQGLIRTHHLNGRVGIPALTVNDDIAVYSFTLEGYIGIGAAHIFDLAAGLGFNMMRDLCGPTWAPTEVMLPHRVPADRRPYDRCFRAPIRFDAERTALAFPASWLSHRTAGANSTTRDRLQDSVDAVADRHGNDLIMRTRRALYVLVMQGQGSMTRVSSLIDMHPRTLNRRLALRGSSISAILEEVKSEIAKQLLADTRMSMIEIASTLNYADPSAFTRAFRRWANVSPTVWRDGQERRATPT